MANMRLCASPAECDTSNLTGYLAFIGWRMGASLRWGHQHSERLRRGADAALGLEVSRAGLMPDALHT